MNLTIYKRTQGKNTRLGTAIASFAIIAIGCWILHQRLQTFDNIWIETLIPAALCAVSAGLIYWLSNLPTVADFLIAAEGEVKKVSWSNRKEIANSTLIVIIVVAVMSAGIGGVDLLFYSFFKYIVQLYGAV